MTTSEKIRYIRVKFELDTRKLSCMLSINRKRLNELENLNANPDKKELLKIERAYKVQKMMSKQKTIQTEIDTQIITLNSLRSSCLNRCSTLNAHTQTEIETYINDILIEGMYLGLMYANNNQDEKVLNNVKRRRK